MTPAGGVGECGRRLAVAGLTVTALGGILEGRQAAPLAQWTEQVPSKHLAGGSNPSRGTIPIDLNSNSTT
jgi:hypothetical protein